MSTIFEELDYRHTPLGAVSLRRRAEPSLGVEVFEVKLNDEFLMSSLFTESEIALAKFALAACGEGPLDVVVGGLGLGYTARAVLDHTSVRSMLVVEALRPVIDWHVEGLVPLGAALTADPRCEFRNGDFFAMIDAPAIDANAPAKRFDAILVDIDHSPRHVLNPAHRSLYTPAGLRRIATHLKPGGVFALWSNDPPDSAFEQSLASVFAANETHVVKFHSAVQRRDVANTIYVARAAPGTP